MSANLPQPKCRIGVFREPAFFDDNFIKGWTAVSGTYTVNGDEITIIGFNAVGRVEKNVGAIDSVTYSKLIVCVTEVNGANTTWGVKIHRTDGNWYNVAAGQTGTGVFSFSLATGNPIDKIALLEEYVGNFTNNVKFDYVAICKNPLLTPVTEDLSVADAIESLEITLPILSRGLAGAKFKLPNFNQQYTGKVKEHDVTLIWLYRTGDTAKKVFGGRVSKVSYEGTAGAPEYYIYVECMDHGDEMQVPPSLLQKVYTGTNGKTIIKDAVALCSYLSNYGVDRSNAIASTHSYVFDEKTPWNVIRDVADACQTSSGAVGFDGYVDPAGNLWIFARGANNSTVDLTDKIIRYKIEYDTYRVKNKIKVYGKAGQIGVPGDSGRCEPSDMDSWTVDSLDNWILDIGAAKYVSMTIKKVGATSLQCNTQTDSPYEVKFHRNLSSICLFGKGAYQTLNFFIMIYWGPAGTKTVQLYAPDSSNYFYATMNVTTYNNWAFNQFELGPNQEYDEVKNPSGPWHKVGSPSWANITAIAFDITSNQADGVFLDGLYFGHGRWRGTAEDSTSQSLYGVRMPEPTIDDSLTSDDECSKRAQSLLAYYKDKVTTLTVETFGNNAFKPGDMQNITLSNDNISGSFRILEITHTLQDVLWKTELLMSNEPIMIDYIFRKMFEAQKTLQTNI